VPAQDWRADVLRGLGAPTTPANLIFLTVWQRFEGGHTNNSARWNWLNTTQGTGYPAINAVGVRAFPDYATGIRYTVSTLLNGRYDNIVAGLRSGRPFAGPLVAAIAGDLQVWVSGSRTGNPTYASRIIGAAGGTAVLPPKGVPGVTRPGGVADLAGGALGTLESAGGWLWGKVGGVWGWARAIAELVAFIVNPLNWLRAVEVLFGFTLMLAGLGILVLEFSKRDTAVGKAAGTAASLVPAGRLLRIGRGGRARSTSRPAAGRQGAAQ